MTDTNTQDRSLHTAVQRLPNRRDRDVIVLGAGPAGAIAAHMLARRGHDVLLLDRARFPRFKVCGGCLNARALAALSAAGLGDLPQQLGALPLQRFALHTSRRSVDVPLPGGVALSRTALDHALVKAAQLSGAELAEGVSGKPAHQRDGYWSVSIQNGSDRREIRARALLVATGLGTKPVKDNAGTGRLTVTPGSRLGAGAVIRGADIAPGTIHMAIGAGGYIGCVRMEDNLVGVAAAYDADFVKSAGGLATAAVKIFEATGQSAPTGLSDALWRGTPLLTRQLRPISGERYLIAGDAAGYVEPFTGEGMAWAMTAGLKAADLIDADIKDAWPSQIERDWEAWYNRNVAGPQQRCRPIVAGLRKKWVVETGAAGLALMPFLATPVINALNAPAAT